MMLYSKNPLTLIMWALLVQLLDAATPRQAAPPGAQCKAVPGSPHWPSVASWAALNVSLSGRLLQPPPPAAVCHPDQPTYNATACPAVQAGWLTSIWHTEDPVSSIENNWNNDTCLPIPTVPCSGVGYPVYVVNATSSGDVKSGIDFARENNVRLIVKGTGHDYLGRSSAPNSLSIWTHHMQGLSFHDGFTPQGCKGSIDTAAITAAAGVQMLEIDYEASLRNLTILSGGAGTVGLGGFLTGGGHSALSLTYGLAADHVLEIEMVTPGGEILTVNECQHKNLFWAMRGGGGSTFGVITSVTFGAFPSSEYATVSAILATAPGIEPFWDASASVMSQFTNLNAQGISGYVFIGPNFTNPALNITTPVAALYGIFNLPLLYPGNSSASLATAVNDVFSTATAPYPGYFTTASNSSLYPDFYSWYAPNNGPLDAGDDLLVGSRLLDEKALTSNMTALKNAFKAATPPGSMAALHFIAGKGVHDAVPRGGSDAVNPAWRKALVHAVVGVGWDPFDTAAKLEQENLLTHTYVAALRALAPDMGAYVNEADPNEPDFQDVFWGANYPRLLSIKREIDPWDVLWCHPCVGNERWEMVGNGLCKKSGFYA